MGTCACGDLDRPSIQRGLRYLLNSQKPDGSWDEEQITGTGFPRVFYLKYDMYRQKIPLLVPPSLLHNLTRSARARSLPTSITAAASEIVRVFIAVIVRTRPRVDCVGSQ